MVIPNPIHNITDKVYHITPDSPQGVVVDARFNLLDARWEYLVTFGVGQTANYFDHELSTHKLFV